MNYYNDDYYYNNTNHNIPFDKKKRLVSGFLPIKIFIEELKRNNIRFSSGCWSFELPFIRRDIYQYSLEFGLNSRISFEAKETLEVISFKVEIWKNSKKVVHILTKEETLSLISDLVIDYGKQKVVRPVLDYEKDFKRWPRLKRWFGQWYRKMKFK